MVDSYVLELWDELLLKDKDPNTEVRECTHLLNRIKTFLLTFSPMYKQDSTVLVDALRNILETSCRPGLYRMCLSHSQMPKAHPEFFWESEVETLLFKDRSILRLNYLTWDVAQVAVTWSWMHFQD